MTRKTALALLALTAALLTGTTQAQRASDILAERDRAIQGGATGSSYRDSVPTYGHGARVQAAEDTYRRQVEEAQAHRLEQRFQQIDRDYRREIDRIDRQFKSDIREIDRQYRQSTWSYDTSPTRIPTPKPPPRRPQGLRSR